MLSRRGFVGSLIGALAAPAIVRFESIMPVKALVPERIFINGMEVFFDHWCERNSIYLLPAAQCYVASPLADLDLVRSCAEMMMIP